MKFIVDAQLSPKLADWFNSLGHDAVHVRGLGLGDQPDLAVLKWAEANAGVVVTKDADFAQLLRGGHRCRVLWLRLGNGSANELIESLRPVWSSIEAALAEGRTLIEISR